MHLGQLLGKNTPDFWEDRAEKVLSHFPYQYPDEIDMYEICAKYGIKIMPLEPVFFDGEIYDEMKSFARPLNKGRRGIIYLKPGLDAVDKKIIMAEEFCHIYAHHVNQLGISPTYVAKLESQVKRMSAYLLMPTAMLQDIYTAAAEQPILVSDIADYFVVTEELAHYRLELIYNHRVDMFASVGKKLWSFEWLE